MPRAAVGGQTARVDHVQTGPPTDFAYGRRCTQWTRVRSAEPRARSLHVFSHQYTPLFTAIFFRGNACNPSGTARRALSRPPGPLERRRRGRPHPRRRAHPGRRRPGRGGGHGRPRPPPRPSRARRRGGWPRGGASRPMSLPIGRSASQRASRWCAAPAGTAPVRRTSERSRATSRRPAPRALVRSCAGPVFALL